MATDTNGRAVLVKAVRDGILLIPDRAAPFQDILDIIEERLAEGGGFFNGARMILDLGARPLVEEEVRALKRTLWVQAGAALTEIRLDSNIDTLVKWATDKLGVTVKLAAPAPAPPSAGEPSPTRELRTLETPVPAAGMMEAMAGAMGADSGEREGPAPVVVRGTCRSGMRVDSPSDCVVIGDVNPGGEIVAVGDVIVFGRLRGIAHAGATGDREAKIHALSIEPNQIRIADLVAVPPREKRKSGRLRYEVALIRNNRIEVTTVSADSR